MFSHLKRHFFVFLKEKTALPAVFLIIIFTANLLLNSNFLKSTNKLPLTATAKASATAAEADLIISESALKSNASTIDLNNSGSDSSFLYNKFLKNNFIVPTTGKNWGVLHGNHGVDIADACGKIVYAADEGLVTDFNINNDWNGGYGNYIIIRHPNGVLTKYAHLKYSKKTLVNKGSYVLQGDPIGYIGNTGLTHGVTGCHLHFEVLGGENPFAH